MNGFYEKISDMKCTSEERKEFLRSRYKYWCEFGKKDIKKVQMIWLILRLAMEMI